jgi:hypothetical protein
MSDHCPLGMQQTLCPGAERLVLANNWSIPCDDVWYFFWPSSILMVLCFGLGIPWLFWLLIKSTVHRLQAFPLMNPPPSEEAKWQMVLLQSSSIARSLFEHYERPWRYWLLFELIQKFFIIVITLFCTFRGMFLLGMILVTVIHVVNFVVLVRWRPFVSNLEDKMTILLSFVMSANYVFCIFIQTKTIVPSPDRPWEGEIITFTLLGVNVVVLFLSAVVTVLLMRSRKKVLSDELKEINEEDCGTFAADEEDGEMPKVSYIMQKGDFEVGSEAFRTHSQRLGMPVVLPEGKKPKDTHVNQPSPSGEVHQEEVSKGDKMELTSMAQSPHSSESPMPSSAQSSPGLQASPKERQVLRLSVSPSDVSQHTKQQLMDMVKVQQSSVNFHVDQDTETYMSRFFMVSGILSFLALAFCFAGILQHTFYGSHVSARPFYASVSLQLVGHKDWKDFTTKCCCLEVELNVEEKWVCEGGFSINRIRKEKDLDGTIVRGYCSREFDPRCQLIMPEDGSIALNCSFPVNKTVLEKLW